eukprot:5377387-Pleurochrysis_carterae.AAC.2
MSAHSDALVCAPPSKAACAQSTRTCAHRVPAPSICACAPLARPPRAHLCAARSCEACDAQLALKGKETHLKFNIFAAKREKTLTPMSPQTPAQRSTSVSLKPVRSKVHLCAQLAKVCWHHAAGRIWCEHVHTYCTCVRDSNGPMNGVIITHTVITEWRTV